MTYAGEEFWKAYGEYLEESEERHTAALDALSNFTDLHTWGHSLFGCRVLDLGCGKHCSAAKLTEPKRYLGVDIDPPDESPKLSSMLRAATPKFIKADYREALGIVIDAVSNPDELGGLFNPQMVTSFFSTEITEIADNNYAIYQRLFRELPSVQYIVVSGFYYTDKLRETAVQEAGGLMSFQTIDLLQPEPEDKDFAEYRVYVPGASKLFGPNVIEVWKLLARKSV